MINVDLFFLALAPFMDKNKIINIFGKNLLNDGNQLKGYYHLIGYESYKPF
ncbi:MAG: hypothetical protein KatS3mg068_0812 [Candidatus Sericytochromatia bacterium]|nr:MAG: hypothetical protein KatS3mg068_0812 [Candidatus Sericytochromatia bacterium]